MKLIKKLILAKSFYWSQK